MSKFSQRMEDLEKVAAALSKKGWRIVRLAVEQELDDKPIASITVQFDPQLSHDIL